MFHRRYLKRDKRKEAREGKYRERGRRPERSSVYIYAVVKGVEIFFKNRNEDEGQVEKSLEKLKGEEGEQKGAGMRKGKDREVLRLLFFWKRGDRKPRHKF